MNLAVPMAAACAALVLSGPCFATYAETENNGSIPYAEPVYFGTVERPFGTVEITGTISANPLAAWSADFDYFSLGWLPAGRTIDAFTTSDFDPVIGIYNSSGTLIAFNDDAVEFDPHLTWTSEAADHYTLLVMGWASDFPYDPFSLTPGNSIGFQGSYTLTLTSVPEPATWGLLLGGLGLLAWRRRSESAAA